MTHIRALIILALFSLLSASLTAQPLIQCPTQSAPLQERWRWALKEGQSRSSQSEFWIGYCIKRLMEKDSYIGSGNMYSGNAMRGRPSLYDMISGANESSKQSSGDWKYAERSNVEKVMKDVALLFRLSGDGKPSIVTIDVSDMELHADLTGYPLLWLGGADDDPSVNLLKDLFVQLSTVKVKKQLVRSVGIHQRSAESFPFLKSLLKSDEPDDVRSQAAFWLGEQNHADALQLLVAVARDDQSIKVREQAVFAVSRIESDESTDALIDLALKTKDSRIRAKAAFWLGEKASQQAVATLEGIVADDEETDVQRQALYALARVHDEAGIDRLIRIAKTHPNPRIRKQAIQCLGQTGDPKALDALIEIVRK